MGMVFQIGDILNMNLNLVSQTFTVSVDNE